MFSVLKQDYDGMELNVIKLISIINYTVKDIIKCKKRASIVKLAKLSQTIYIYNNILIIFEIVYLMFSRFQQLVTSEVVLPTQQKQEFVLPSIVFNTG